MRWRPRLLPADPPELLVYDDPTPCPYLEGRQARMPLRVPTRMLTPAEFAARLRTGDRRQGVLLYRTACPSCRACEPIRIDTAEFTPKQDPATDLPPRPRAPRHRDRPARAHQREGRPLQPPQDRPRPQPRRPSTSTSRATAPSSSTAAATPSRSATAVDGRLIAVAVVDRSETLAVGRLLLLRPRPRTQESPGVYSILKQLRAVPHAGACATSTSASTSPSARRWPTSAATSRTSASSRAAGNASTADTAASTSAYEALL
jgi:hypothetical protein